MDVRWVLLSFSCACLLLLACEGTRVLQPKKNSIKTVKTVDGDIFDCVHIYKQPAFDHPLMKDHKVQMKPSSFSEILSSDASSPHEKNVISEFKMENDEGCPDGYIPVHRIERDDELEAHAQDLAIKVPSTYDRPANVKHWWAQKDIKSENWYGGGAAFTVWNPPVAPTQLSASLLWLVSTKFNVIITAGWHVLPAVFHDSKTRLTIVWTKESSTRATCFNLQCGGFVQTNKNVLLGGVLSPVSVYKGDQYIIRVYVFKDPNTGNWWFSFGSPNNIVGYWPQVLFPAGLESVELMSYGGYVACNQNETCPPMGNGDRPASNILTDYSAVIGEAKFAALNSTMVGLTGIVPVSHSTDPDCYDVGLYSYPAGFHYGGHGCY